VWGLNAGRGYVPFGLWFALRADIFTLGIVFDRLFGLGQRSGGKMIFHWKSYSPVFLFGKRKNKK
jgi:hypothetical protein